LLNPEGASFAAALPGQMEPGQYRLCFCDALKDPTLETCADEILPGGAGSPSWGYQCTDWAASSVIPGVPDCDPQFDGVWTDPGAGNEYTYAEMELIRMYCPASCGVCASNETAGYTPQLTWRVELHARAIHTLVVDHPDLCAVKCMKGCVGPHCNCETYTEMAAEGVPGLEGALCIDAADCRALCDDTEDCSAYSLHVEAPICWLARNATSEINGDSNVWFAEEGRACSSPGDFFPALTIGTLSVTSRVDVGVDYVVVPGKPATLEITGRRLGALDRAMLIPGFGTCGAPEPGEWSSGVLRPTAESTAAMLQITNVQLKAGSYKLCFCDAEVSGPCRDAYDYTVDVGRVHSSGLSCLFGTKGVTMACTDMPGDGYRCVADEIPALA
jgi:hypothetical protein